MKMGLVMKMDQFKNISGGKSSKITKKLTYSPVQLV